MMVKEDKKKNVPFLKFITSFNKCREAFLKNNEKNVHLVYHLAPDSQGRYMEK